MADGKKGNMFIVGRHEFAAACGIGMNPAIAFLIMASGSKGNNRTTIWSCKSIAERAGITRARAEKAVLMLIEHGLVEKIRGGTNPKYHLKLSENASSYLYLPRSIVDGVGNEVPPLERIRQSMKVDYLFIFILLYFVQDIDNEYGIPTSAFKNYSSKLSEVYHNDMATILHCDESTWELNWQWYAGSLFQQMGIDFNDFKPAFHELRDMGLVTAWGLTFESSGEDAEAICGIYDYSYVSELHDQINRCCKKKQNWPRNGPYIIVPKHVKEPEIRTSARLTYLPQTTKTARFYAMKVKIDGRTRQLIDNAVKIETSKAIGREDELEF